MFSGSKSDKSKGQRSRLNKKARKDGTYDGYRPPQDFDEVDTGDEVESGDESHGDTQKPLGQPAQEVETKPAAGAPQLDDSCVDFATVVLPITYPVPTPILTPTLTQFPFPSSVPRSIPGARLTGDEVVVHLPPAAVSAPSSSFKRKSSSVEVRKM